MKKILVALIVMIVTMSGAFAKGNWQSGKHDAGAAGSRDYRIWLPDGYDGKKPLPMVVALHGCTQDAEVFATQTGLNALADTMKFIVLYPLQAAAVNSMYCWNWMLGVNQSREGGEPAIISGMARQVAKEVAVDSARIYVTGLSAGGAMTANLMACYPDVFAAGAIHGGMMFRAAADPGTAIAAMSDASKNSSPEETGRAAWECSGKFRKPVPVMIWHGSADSIVSPGNVDYMVRQFVKLNDLADDGEENGSVSTKNPDIKNVKSDRKTLTIESYRGFNQDVVVKYLVQGMDHAWSGGSDKIQYSDPGAPDATRLMLEWFLTKSR